jgi:hypothetical protein
MLNRALSLALMAFLMGCSRNQPNKSVNFDKVDEGQCLIHREAFEQRHLKVAILRNGRRECIDEITLVCKKCEIKSKELRKVAQQGAEPDAGTDRKLTP